MPTTDPLDPLSGTTNFTSTDTGETTTGDSTGITSTGYDSQSQSNIDLTPLDTNDLLPDKDYSAFTGGLLSSGEGKLDTSGSSSVADNMTSLLDKNSAYLRQAEDFANRAANKRGLLNSSMAVGAADAARIQAALPIAQQDAQTQAAFQQQQAGTYFDMAKQQQSGNIQSYLDQIKGSYALRGQELSDEQALQLAREQMAFAGGQAQLDRAQQFQMLQEEYAQRAGLSLQEADQALNYMQTEYGERGDLSLQDYQQQVLRDTNLNELQKNYLIQDYALRETFAQAGQTRQLELLQEQTDQQIRLADQQAWHAENLQLLQGEQKVQLANIEGQWKNLYQTNATASKFYSEIQQEITKLMQDVDIPAATRDTFIARQIDALEAGFEVIGAVADLDIGSLLNFGSATVTPT